MSRDLTLDQVIAELEKDTELTLGECYGAAVAVKKQEDADRYFKALVASAQRKWGKTLEQATADEKANLGYYAGYYDQETNIRVQRLYNCQHPVFGKRTNVSHAEAFKAGQDMAARKAS